MSAIETYTILEGEEKEKMKEKMLKSLITRSMKVLNVLITVALFCLCWRFYYGPQLGLGQYAKYIVAVGILYMAAVVLLGRIYNAFAAGTYRVSQLAYSQGLTALIADVAAYVLMVVMTLRFSNPLPLLGLVTAQVLWSVIWSLVANKLYFATHAPRKTVIVYCQDSELRKLEEIKHFEKKFCVMKYIREPKDYQLLVEALQGAEVVFATGLDMDTRNAVAKYCITHGAQCYIQPRVGDVIMAGAEHMQMFSVPTMRIRKASPAPEYLFVKRLFDIVASVLAIIVMSPFMLGTALLIKLYDRGPVLYKQVRLTKDRKAFKVLKFRSMRTDAEKDGVARLSTENDDRITPVGKIIRKIRFDELPQLFNILKGDMTIVGPRPERPEIAAQYEKEIPSFGLRLQVKAGLTGYAQIYGRYNTEPYDKLKMDLMYINHMSLVEDLRLMLATVKILFMAESTEGIEDGQTTASVQSTEEKSLVGAGKK